MCISVETYKTKYSKSVVKKTACAEKGRSYWEHMREIRLLMLALGYVLFRLKKNEEVKTDLHVL